MNWISRIDNSLFYYIMKDFIDIKYFSHYFPLIEVSSDLAWLLPFPSKTSNKKNI